MSTTEDHVLRTLSLPSRYEPLVAKIGPEILNLLVKPTAATMRALEVVASSAESGEEGFFLPLVAESGTGKTTLAENLKTFLPQSFAPTLTFTGEVSLEALRSALENFVAERLDRTDNRIIPINVDHREGRPATPEEVSAIKFFLRVGVGSRALLIWPETSAELATSMAAAYKKITGEPPLDLPLEVEGPPRDSWVGLAKQTLELANQVDSLENLLGLDQYNIDQFQSLGDFLRRISVDFNKRKIELRERAAKDVDLTILFVSETVGHGILSSLTSSRRFGMLDPSALLQASGGSKIGKWWAGHRGLLIEVIVFLDAHAFGVAPPLSLSVFRRFGPEEVQKALVDLDFSQRSPATISDLVNRSDFGRHMAREERSVGETRGNPSEGARVVYEAYAEYMGFNGGKDKRLNKAFAQAIPLSAAYDNWHESVIRDEEAVAVLPTLIPDVSVESASEVHCFEFTYRKGDWLTSTNRAAAAVYCLEKLRNYAISLGWVSASS